MPIECLLDNDAAACTSLQTLCCKGRNSLSIDADGYSLKRVRFAICLLSCTSVLNCTVCLLLCGVGHTRRAVGFAVLCTSCYLYHRWLLTVAFRLVRCIQSLSGTCIFFLNSPLDLFSRHLRNSQRMISQSLLLRLMRIHVLPKRLDLIL